MVDKNIEKYETPKITVTHYKIDNKYPDDMIIDPDTGQLCYGLLIEGLKGYRHTRSADDEFRELTTHYYRIIRNQNALLNETQQEILKQHVLLWFREKLAEGNIFR